ncbi:unnamed protein product [Chrysoparadoxa australica]
MKPHGSHGSPTERDSLLAKFPAQPQPPITQVDEDLVTRGNRWEDLAGGRSVQGEGPRAEALEPGLDRIEIAALYINDALAGGLMWSHISNSWALEVTKIMRSKCFVNFYRGLLSLHLLLPLLEVTQVEGQDSNALISGVGFPWPTVYGSSCVEVFLCVFYLAKILLSRYVELSAHVKFHRMGWAYARMALTAGLLIDLALFFITWSLGNRHYFRWGRAFVPFILITLMPQTRLLLGSVIRVFPRLMPILALVLFAVLFWGFFGFLLFNQVQGKEGFYTSLEFFGTLQSSWLTALRIMSSSPYILDLEENYPGRACRIYCVTYSWISIVLLTSLVTAVANKLFKEVNIEAYQLVRVRRAEALQSAFDLIKEEGESEPTVDLGSWLLLIRRMRPDLSAYEAAALFDAANVQGGNEGKKMGGERHSFRQSRSNSGSSCLKSGEGREKSEKSAASESASGSLPQLLPSMPSMSKTIFFRACSLIGEDVSSPHVEESPLPVLLEGQAERLQSTKSMGSSSQGEHSTRSNLRRRWLHLRKRIWDLLHYHVHVFGESFNLHWAIYYVAVVAQAAELFARNGSHRPSLACVVTGYALLALFCLDSVLVMVAYNGSGMDWCHWNGIVINCLILVSLLVQRTTSGAHCSQAYSIITSLRLLMLWRILRRGTFGGVARRIELILPALLRAVFISTSVIYAWSVVAHGLLRDAPISHIDPAAWKGYDSVSKFLNYQDDLGFTTFANSLVSMFDIVILSGWTMIMDAVAEVSGENAKWRLFFYTYKLSMFYYVLPVMVGYTVQCYIAVALKPVHSEVMPAELKDLELEEEGSRPMPRIRRKVDRSNSTSLLFAGADAEEDKRLTAEKGLLSLELVESLQGELEAVRKANRQLQWQLAALSSSNLAGPKPRRGTTTGIAAAAQQLKRK